MTCPVASELPVPALRHPVLPALLACAALAWSGVRPPSILIAQEVAPEQVDALHWRCRRCATGVLMDGVACRTHTDRNPVLLPVIVYKMYIYSNPPVRHAVQGDTRKHAYETHHHR